MFKLNVNVKVILTDTGSYSLGQRVDLGVEEAVAGGWNHVVEGHVHARVDHRLELVGGRLALLHLGDVGLGDVGRVARLVDHFRALAEEGRQVLYLRARLVAAWADWFGLVAARDQDEDVLDALEGPLLARLAVARRVLPHHPLPLGHEVGDLVDHHLEVEDGVLVAGVVGVLPSHDVPTLAPFPRPPPLSLSPPLAPRPPALPLPFLLLPPLVSPPPFGHFRSAPLLNPPPRGSFSPLGHLFPPPLVFNLIVFISGLFGAPRLPGLGQVGV